jgi:hypothetical protein
VVTPDAETIRASLAALADVSALFDSDAITELLPRIWPYSFTYLWDALLVDDAVATTFGARYDLARTVAYSIPPWRPEDWTEEHEALLGWLAAAGPDDVTAAAERLASDPDFVRFAHREVADLDRVARTAMGDPSGPLAERTEANVGHHEGHVVYAVLLLAVSAALGGYLGLVAAGKAQGSVGDRATVVAVFLLLAERLWDEASPDD